MDLDGKTKVWWLLPCQLNALKITNLTMIIDVNTTSEDQVHYQIGGGSYFNIGDFDVTMEQWAWQILIDSNKAMILDMTNKFLNKALPMFLSYKTK
jgi:hypothetical protein